MDNNYLEIIISKNVLIKCLILIITLIHFSSSSFGNQKTYLYKDENIDISFLKAWDSKEATLYALFIKMKKKLENLLEISRGFWLFTRI